jgi:hypothetical protein
MFLGLCFGKLAMGCMENASGKMPWADKFPDQFPDQFPGKSLEVTAFRTLGPKQNYVHGARVHAHEAGPGTWALRYWQQLSAKTSPAKSVMCLMLKSCVLCFVDDRITKTRVQQPRL